MRYRYEVRGMELWRYECINREARALDTSVQDYNAVSPTNKVVYSKNKAAYSKNKAVYPMNKAVCYMNGLVSSSNNTVYSENKKRRLVQLGMKE